MCNNSKIISSLKNGELSVCKGCKIYSLTYNNLFFQFDKEQLLNFRQYIENIDIDYWLDCNSCKRKKRKIPISTPDQGLILFFSENEIKDLKSLTLLNKVTKDKLLASEIDYTFVLN